MSKRKVLLISILILIVMLSGLFLNYKDFMNKKEKSLLKEYTKVDKKHFKMYVQKADKSGYDEVSTSTFPTTGYELNENNSYCLDNNGDPLTGVNISYNNGKVTITSKKTAYCTIYFDVERPDITVNLTNYNATYNTQTPTCTTNDSVYFNTKYQALVFNNVGNRAANCTLTSSNANLSSTKTTLKDTITGLITSGNTNAASGTNAMIVDETSETVTNSTNVTLTVGYRYEGQNPNNYIWFNNEMWRIIGVVPVCTSANCATKEDLVKIIRKDSIGSIAYDAKASGYTGAWGSNTLYTLLNTKYWGKENATNTATCYGFGATPKTKCDYTVIGLSGSDYYGNMVKQDVYWNTGASTNDANAKTVYVNESQTQQVQGNIGLMNASDYGYGSSESTRGNLSSYNNSAITLANWLYTNNYEWTITQYTTASSVLDVPGAGHVLSNDANRGFAVRPALYLKDSVYVVNGDGSEATPYQVAIGS